ncbi:MAG: hypothetical protein Q4B79_09115, partial [Moraxella sp.]|uniref:hypothetical protein n=1 Tax=Moraxella sp. TaxID=479 RepID=UPI0026DB6614
DGTNVYVWFVTFKFGFGHNSFPLKITLNNQMLKSKELSGSSNHVGCFALDGDNERIFQVIHCRFTSSEQITHHHLWR